MLLLVHCFGGHLMSMLLALCSVFLKNSLKFSEIKLPPTSYWVVHILKKKKTLHVSIKLSADRTSIILITG